eukprot:GHRQ01031547.1.p1 GENE.GHRQ01031547.1~~GHRQ01031547.1.p1  ORF type:complete len:162 (+),score=36.76 GHRQ01031547.1:705-1190(+)
MPAPPLLNRDTAFWSCKVVTVPHSKCTKLLLEKTVSAVVCITVVCRAWQHELVVSGFCFLQVLAVVAGGRLSLHGSSISTRTTRLAAAAAAGSTDLTVEGNSSTLAGWSVGKQILVTSTTFNPDQVEFRRIIAAQPDAASGQLVLTLDSPLAWGHHGGVFR